MVLSMHKYTVVSCITPDEDKVFTDKDKAIDYAKREITKRLDSSYERFVVFFGQPNANATVSTRQVVAEICGKFGKITADSTKSAAADV